MVQCMVQSFQSLFLEHKFGFEFSSTFFHEVNSNQQSVSNFHCSKNFPKMIFFRDFLQHLLDTKMDKPSFVLVAAEELNRVIKKISDNNSSIFFFELSVKSHIMGKKMEKQCDKKNWISSRRAIKLHHFCTNIKQRPGKCDLLLGR